MNLKELSSRLPMSTLALTLTPALMQARSRSLSLFQCKSQPKTLCFVLVDCGSIEPIMRRCKDATQLFHIEWYHGGVMGSSATSTVAAVVMNESEWMRKTKFLHCRAPQQSVLHKHSLRLDAYNTRISCGIFFVIFWRIQQKEETLLLLFLNEM